MVPATASPRSSLAITYAAPLFDVSGYAAMARAVVLGLDALGVGVTVQPLWQAGVPEIHRLNALPAEIAGAMRRLASAGAPIDVALRPAAGGRAQAICLRLPDGSLYEYRTPVETRVVERILELASRPAPRDSAHVTHMLPANGTTDFYAAARAANPGHPWYVGSTMFETAGIPAGWAAAANGMDELWVPSHFNLETFRAGGVALEKIRVLPLGIDTARYDPLHVRPLAIENRRGFTFLSVFQWTRRKGWDVLLRAYLDAFRADDEVTLVLRAYYGGGASVAARLREAIVSLGHDPARCPEIVLLDACIPDTLLPSLYAACDAYVLPSRGEGWGMPYLEAMAMGKPVIGTRWGGNLEFMTDENAFLVDVEGLRPVDAEQLRDNALYQGQLWAEPSAAHTAELMRRVFEDRREAARRAERARRDVVESWTHRRQAERIHARIAAIEGELAARRGPRSHPTPAAARRGDGTAAPAAPRATAPVGGVRVHVVLVDEGWILERCAHELARRLDYVDIGRAADPSAAVNYYVNYAGYAGRRSAIEIAFFTHVEERVPEAARRFFEVARAVEACVCMSRRYADALRDAGVRDVALITPGVDLDAYRPVVRIAVVGRAYPTGRKGEALVRAVMDEPGIEWHFTGEGWPGPAERHPAERMPLFYQSVDYVLVPAYYEGGPMPLLEALACGKEVIAPPVGFVPDYPHIEFKTGDAEDLRRVLRGLVAARAALRETVVARTWDAWAAEHDTLFRRLLPAGRPRARAPRAPGRSAPEPLRVLLALHAPERGSGGGPSVRVPKLAAGLRALGVEADVAESELPDPCGYDLVHVFNVWEPGAALVQLRHLRRFDVPIVFSPIYLDLAELTWAVRAIPSLFRAAASPAELADYLAAAADGSLLADELRRFGRNEIVPGYFAGLREMVGLVDHLVALSEIEMERLWAAGVAPKPYTLVRNGVDAARFATASPRPFVERYGVRDYVLCVGRIECRKNQLMLVQALRDTELPLVLIGAAAEPDYAALVRRHAAAGAHIIERLPHDSDLLAAAYAGARVFALPSWCEGAPLSALEAGAAGTALVLSDRSGEVEYFGDLALYCDPGDVTSIRTAVSRAYAQEPEEGRRAALAARTAAYTWEAAARATLAAYRETLGRARTAAPECPRDDGSDDGAAAAVAAR